MLRNMADSKYSVLTSAVLKHCEVTWMTITGRFTRENKHDHTK